MEIEYEEPAGLQADDETEERLTVAFWPSAAALGANRNVRTASRAKGQVAQTKGLLGFAAFPYLDSDGDPLGSCMVIASTMPVVLAGSPITKGQPIVLDYHQVGDFPFTLAVSNNVSDSDGINASILSAVASVAAPGSKTFIGDFLFLTFSSTADVDIDGPSCGLAVFIAIQGFGSRFYYTGEISVNDGIPVLLHVNGLAQKITMVAQAGGTLVGTMSAANAAEVSSATSSYVGPLQAMMGGVRPQGEKTSFIGIADLGTAVLVAFQSEMAGIASTVAGVKSHAESVATKPTRSKPAQQLEVLDVVLAASGLTREAWDKKMTVPNFVDSKIYAKVQRAQNSLNNFSTNPKVLVEVRQAARTLKVPEDRIDNVIGNGVGKTMYGWLKQVELLEQQASKKGATKKKGQPVQVKGSTTKAVSVIKRKMATGVAPVYPKGKQAAMVPVEQEPKEEPPAEPTEGDPEEYDIATWE